MTVTKCDICGTYVDKHPDYMPYVHFGYDDEDEPFERDVCYACYSDILDMFHIDHNKEDKK